MLLTPDQRYQLANRLLDIIQSIMIKEKAPSAPQGATIPAKIPSDAFDSTDFDAHIEQSALSFLKINEGEDDGEQDIR